MSVTADEIKKINKLLNDTSSVMVSGVARLYLASPNLHNPKLNETLLRFPNLNSNTWTRVPVQGAAVIVVDRSTGQVLLQIYDLYGEIKKRFEYELYYNMEYVSLDPGFHAFEMDDCVAGLSFSSSEVGRKFYLKAVTLVPKPEDDAPASQVQARTEKKKGLFGLGSSFTSKPPPPPQMEISGVINVIHQQHVGLTKDGEFDFGALAPEWKAVFKAAGVKKKDLTNPETRRVVMQSIALSGYSLASAPATYVHAQKAPQIMSPQMNGGGAPKSTPVQNQFQEMSINNNNPFDDDDDEENGGNLPKNSFTREQLQSENYDEKQISEYEVYLKALADYERQVADFQREQEAYVRKLAEYEREKALQAWERDNQQIIKETEKKEKKSGAPPPLPPRKTLVGGDGGASSPSSPKNSVSAAAAGSFSSSAPPPRVPSASKKPSSSAAAATNGGRQSPPPPPVVTYKAPPAPPAAPSLPNLSSGKNPVEMLKKSSAGARPNSKMFLSALKNAAGTLKEASDRKLEAPVRDVAKTADLLKILGTAMAARRNQLGEDDEEDDWSD